MKVNPKMVSLTVINHDLVSETSVIINEYDMKKLKVIQDSQLVLTHKNISFVAEKVDPGC